ncbi:hypothetical protein AC1031_014109 [Aphanomyces cochlioides]|nr:hypothetical protein AC1031_014109 [Aphanomyces cochlioides]
MLTDPAYGTQEERNEVQVEILEVIHSRWKSFHTPVMLKSFLLDPTKEKVGYMDKRLKNFKKELENFVAKKDQWPIEVLNGNRTKSPPSPPITLIYHSSLNDFSAYQHLQLQVNAHGAFTDSSTAKIEIDLIQAK